MPEFDFTGGVNFTGLGETGSMPNFKIHQVHQYLDNVTWNHGNHSFKFGTDLHWQRSDILGGNSSHGLFTFNGSYTGASLADFLLGDASGGTLSTQLVGEMRFENYMFYAQDDWKVTPKLTVNIGLRYEFTTPWYEKHNHMDTLVLNPGPTFGTIQTAGYCGDSLSCRGLTELNLLSFAPRLGLAYQLDQKTVVRAAAGTVLRRPGSDRGQRPGGQQFSVQLQRCHHRHQHHAGSAIEHGISGRYHAGLRHAAGEFDVGCLGEVFPRTDDLSVEPHRGARTGRAACVDHGLRRIFLELSFGIL